MQLGLIADIHADLAGLEAALRHLQEGHQVDDILCAGDLVGYGQQPNAVLDVFRTMQIVTVKGNHDSPSADIHPENADYLNQLPHEWRATMGGVRLYMCHGIPLTNFIGFSAQTLEREQIQAMVREVQADVIIAGHTHHIFCGRVDETWIVNPGAVYTRSEEGSSHSYGVLNLVARTFTVYDVRLPIADGLIAQYRLDSQT